MRDNKMNDNKNFKNMKKVVIINLVGILIVSLIYAIFDALHAGGVAGIGGYSGLITGSIIVHSFAPCIIGLIIAFIGKLFKKNFPVIFIKSSWIICAINIAIGVFSTIDILNKMSGSDSVPFSTLFYTFLGIMFVAYLFWEFTGLNKKNKNNEKDSSN